MAQVEREAPNENHFEEKTAAFLRKLSRIGAVSHLGLVGYHDEHNYRCVNFYALTRDSIDVHDRHRGKKLKAVADAFNVYSYAVSPTLCTYLHLVDSAKYTPGKLEELLKTSCRKGREFLGFEAIPISGSVQRAESG